MATYLIGDLQGCHADLLALFDRIGFDSTRDRAWFTGDLVNRGPSSLAVLRTVKSLGARAVVVLGNHDLHLLACRYVAAALRPGDTLRQVLDAPDRDELLDWLRTRPLLHHDPVHAVTLVHAGLPPQWSLEDALGLAAEASRMLAGPDPAAALRDMYGNRPDRWTPALHGAERFRFVVNALTRLRYVDADGRLELRAKGAPGSQRPGLVPWFAAPARRSRATRIAFGHWSTLRLTPAEQAWHNVLPLDTGAVWGGTLTAVRLDDGAFFAVPGSTPIPLEPD